MRRVPAVALVGMLFSGIAAAQTGTGTGSPSSSSSSATSGTGSAGSPGATTVAPPSNLTPPIPPPGAGSARARGVTGASRATPMVARSPRGASSQADSSSAQSRNAQEAEARMQRRNDELNRNLMRSICRGC